METPNKRRRARKAHGSSKGNNAETKLHEALALSPIKTALCDNSVTYGVKQKVDGTSKPTAGKYGKKAKVRPTFGNVTSTTY